MNGKLHGGIGRFGALLVTLALVAPPSVRGQAPAPPPSTVPLAMAGSIGSFAGLAFGAMVGVQSGWGGDGEDSFVGGVVLASAGAIIGTTVGMKLAAYEDVSARKALGASLVGFGAGLAVSYALAGASSDGTALPIVFSVSQGVVAALVANAWSGG